ncbi:hypothetical protein K9M48_00565 [Candidatus Gracilibacteria bacterium]|nr:hypothetical protein [Candidatus Gracilibacteria bacterium]
MILIPILLCFFTGLLILWLCNQHKYLNIFEQLVLGFVSALSLFVLELFFQGIIFDKLSLILPIITFIICLLLFIYKNNKHKGLIREILENIGKDFDKIKSQFKGLRNRKQYLTILVLIYAIFKIFMVFSININMPTFDEDAVAGRDMKTKIFSSNKSLVLDNTNSEYFGTDYGRYPFAGITDTYFLLPYNTFINGLGNVIAPFIYLLSIILLLGIFLRKTNLFFVILSLYIFTSLPFVFIHGFGSYRNFPAGVFLFIFIFYLIDQILNIEKTDICNKGILLPLILVGFISSFVRNEGVMLTGITLLFSIFLYHIFRRGKIKEIKYQIFTIIPIISIYIINKVVFSLYPAGNVLNTGGTEINSNLFNSFFSNIAKSDIFLAPFQQMFYHPDYILLFVLFAVSLILFSINYKKIKSLWIFNIITVLILLLFMFVLYANVESLGLLSHFAFIRYPVSIILFLIYFIGSTLYLGINENENGL